MVMDVEDIGQVQAVERCSSDFCSIRVMERLSGHSENGPTVAGSGLT